MNFSFIAQEQSKSDVFVFCVYDQNVFSPETKEKALEMGLDLSWYLEGLKTFKAKAGDTFVIPVPRETGVRHVVLLGLGKQDDLNRRVYEKAGAKLYKALKSLGTEKATIKLDLNDQAAFCAVYLSMGMKLGGYSFDRYKKKPEEDEDLPVLSSVDFILKDVDEAKTLFEIERAVVEGTLWARDLVNEPANIIHPESLVDAIKQELEPLGVTVDVLDEKKMEKLGMGAFLSVGQGSACPSKLVILRWKSADSDSNLNDKPLAFIGKGITFDTGGVNIKISGEYLPIMKMDMGGAATVVGLMKALASRKAPVHVVGAVALAENMLSDKASRPGDIVRSMSGKTIEIINTDAEGRMVLCDTLTYVQEKYTPSVVIDIATLTGSVISALGTEYAGLFTNDDNLWNNLELSGKETGEVLWRMPLGEQFTEEIKGSVSDVKNLGGTGRIAGASTAGAFLQEFIVEDLPWAHMDIAGAAWANKDRPTVPKGGTGFGVRVLNDFITRNYERK